MKRAAWHLRKLADFLDPRVGPSEAVIVRVEVDSAEAEAALSRLAEQAKAFTTATGLHRP